MRGPGWSNAPEGTVHAVSLIDSYVGGFVLQEANLPITDTRGGRATTARRCQEMR